MPQGSKPGSQRDSCCVSTIARRHLKSCKWREPGRELTSRTLSGFLRCSQRSMIDVLKVGHLDLMLNSFCRARDCAKYRTASHARSRVSSCPSGVAVHQVKPIRNTRQSLSSYMELYLALPPCASISGCNRDDQANQSELRRSLIPSPSSYVSYNVPLHSDDCEANQQKCS